MPDAHSPDGSDGAEARVALLRDDVAAILHEMERRYERVTAVPRRLEAHKRQIGVALLTAAVVGTTLALWLRARRRKRSWLRLRA